MPVLLVPVWTEAVTCESIETEVYFLVSSQLLAAAYVSMDTEAVAVGPAVEVTVISYVVVLICWFDILMLECVNVGMC